MNYPFDVTGIERGADGIARFTGLPASVVAMLRNMARARSDAEAIVEVGGERVAYAELWERASRVAGGLRDTGIARGDRVAIRLGNGLHFVLAFYGVELAGAIAVPVNMRLSEAEVEYIVNDSGSKFVFVPGAPLPDGAPLAVDDLQSGDIAAIFYTSGTTGFPKGAITTHGNFVSNTEVCRRGLKMASDGAVRTLVALPLFHVAACNCQLLLMCAVGGTSVIMPQFQVAEYLRLIGAERIDFLLCVPAMYFLLVNHADFEAASRAQIRWAGYGAAPTPPALIEQIVAGFPNARASNGFGMTECSAAAFLPPEYALSHVQSVGLAAPSVDVKLQDGELLVRSPCVVAGYWNKPEATADAFVDGWLHTGDIASIDADGFVQILDRKKDMLIRGGENVYCIEVEGALAAHPAVLELAVIGVVCPMMGERVGVVVVQKPGQLCDADELLESVRDKLADYKVPEYVIVRDEPLPRNATGKVLKRALRETLVWGERARGARR